MTGRYASQTTVSSEQSRMEIERTLTRYGADQFVYASEPARAIIIFRLNGRRIRFDLPLPDRKSPEFTEYTQGRSRFARTEPAAERLWEQACRQRWRALALVIKAKLEAVDVGITSAEDEFLAHTMMSDGTRFGAWAQPQIEQMYRLGQMPDLLLLTAGSPS